jgi:hypothetical protein
MIFETAVRVANNGKKIRPKCGLPSTQQNQSITAKFFNGIGPIPDVGGFGMTAWKRTLAASGRL